MSPLRVIFVALLLSLSLFSFTFVANANLSQPSHSQHTIKIRFSVPVVCRATFTAALSDISSNSGAYRNLGSIHEFCNSPTGYKVYLEFSGDLEDAGTIHYGGDSFLIDKKRILVTDVDGAGSLVKNIQYFPGDSTVSQMSVRIEPKYL